jgi:hypothetical protein
VTTYQGRMLLGLGVAFWVVSVLFVIACLVAPSFVGAAGCELGSGSSVFGEPSRSWLPPGTTCTYDLSGYGLPSAVIIEPSPLRLVVVVAALIGLPALLRLRHLLTGGAPAGS